MGELLMSRDDHKAALLHALEEALFRTVYRAVIDALIEDDDLFADLCGLRTERRGG